MKKEAPYRASQAGSFLLGGNLLIHRLGFGAMHLTGPNIWGETKDKKEACAILKKALDLGVNFIDTADSYGPETSELMIAEALYPYPSGLVIATKGGLVRPGPGRWEPLGRPEYLVQCVEMSLRRLRIERIDLYQLHAVDPLVPLEESLGALKEMQLQGKIRYIGLSNVSVQEIERAQRVVEIVSVQNQYNFFYRKSESVLHFCEAHRLAFIPWFPIGSGNLANARGAFEQIAKEKGVTTAQLAIAWLLHHSQVMLPIPGTSNLKHLEENLKAATLDLKQEELIQIERIKSEWNY
jgi:aryl-alcohol dehydrogenase-like predicted oxidoreductase